MKKAMKTAVSFALIFAMMFTMMSFSAMAAESTPADCYADTDQIVLTYASAPAENTSVTLKQGDANVEINTSVESNKLVITPASGNFQRDVVYKLTAGQYTQYFKIKTLVDGISENAVNGVSSSIKGDKDKAAVFIDSDADGKKELYAYNTSAGLSFNDNEINSAKNYTVKYTLSSYAIVKSESENPSSNANGVYDYYNKVINYLAWNGAEAKQNSGMGGIQLGNGNWQPIKEYKSGSYAHVDSISVNDAGLNKFVESNSKAAEPVNHGKILYDNGTSDIEILKQPGVYANIKLKKLAKDGTLYVDGKEIYTASSTSAESGYFLFGGGEGSMHNFIGIKDFVATTYEPLTITEIKPVDYYGDKDKLTITFDNAVDEITDGTITVTQDGATVDTTASVKSDDDKKTVIVKPTSGEFARDVESTVTISRNFGNENSFTQKAYNKSFVIKTVQDKLDENTFGTSNKNKHYKDGKVYICNTRLNSVNPNLKDYTVTMKINPYLNSEDSTEDKHLYMQMSFNNADSGSYTPGDTVWNFQKYDFGDNKYAMYHATVNSDGSLTTKWTGIITNADMGMPARESVQSMKASTFEVDNTGVATPTEPVTFTVTKRGRVGILTVGEKSDEITTTNETGYFILKNAASQSILEVSEFIMTTFVEGVGDVSVENATAAKADSAVTVTYDIKKNGTETSYPVWIIAAAYDSSKALIGAAAGSVTLSADMTGQSISIPVVADDVSEIKIFVWDSQESIKPYCEPVEDITVK